MSSATQYYIVTLGVYFIINSILLWGLNIQFGLTGIVNFGYYAFVAAGAYIASMLTLGPPSNSFVSQHYLFGANLPYPLPVLFAGAAGGIFGAIVGLLVLRRLRTDYLAIATLVVGQIAWIIAGNNTSLVNGQAGLSQVPQPLSDRLTVDPLTYNWIFLGISLVIGIIVLFFTIRLTRSPFGRALRSVRENEWAAGALGKRATTLRMSAMVIGGVMAGLGGALFAEYLMSWAPGGWSFSENFVLYTALILGGMGNTYGAMIGSLVVPVGVYQVVSLLPPIGGNATVNAAVQWIILGVLLLAVMWFRPQGVLPERKARFPASPQAEEAALSPAIAGEIPVALATIGEASSGLPLPQTSRIQATEPILEIEGIRCAFGGVQALAGSTFSVRRGTITGLIGPNGAGKSTLIGVVGGAIKPDAGHVRFNGHDITGLPDWKIARLGLTRTYQISSEFSRMTVLENMMVGAADQQGERLWKAFAGPRFWRQTEMASLRRARDLLQDFDLGDLEDHYAGQLSGGQKRLLELARAMMSSPEFLLLDEPMAGVNPSLVDRLVVQVERLRDLGVTILLVEHELDLVERLCDHVVTMAQGTVLAEGSMDQLRRHEQVVEAYLAG
ncbi:MAG: branched-chain amino acid ABC transporter ATP-binding protein/permease [Chloroflexota bacterium]|nr:branched-chain amino acid ABC transporter ATP-binding protein/permease [Chloroflexota bacterium]